MSKQSECPIVVVTGHKQSECPIVVVTGHELYRVRQGDYRIVYSIDDDEVVVEVIKIGHRRAIYRGL